MDTSDTAANVWDEIPHRQAAGRPEAVSLLGIFDDLSNQARRAPPSVAENAWFLAAIEKLL